MIFLIKEHGKPQSREQYTVPEKTCHIIATIAAKHVPPDHLILFAGENQVNVWQYTPLAQIVLGDARCWQI